jgi:hypothetical protein
MATKHILVSGGLIYSGALAQAITSGVHGIITGGINSSDYKSLRGGKLAFPGKYGSDIGLSLVVCEGFGSIPIGEDIFTILQKYNNQFVIIDGNAGKITLPACDSDCIIQIRKVALPQGLKQNYIDSIPEVEAVNLERGQKVRVIAAPFMGEQGVVDTIDATPTVLKSRISTFLVTITTKSRKIRVPYLNIEVIN